MPRPAAIRQRRSSGNPPRPGPLRRRRAGRLSGRRAARPGPPHPRPALLHHYRCLRRGDQRRFHRRPSRLPRRGRGGPQRSLGRPAGGGHLPGRRPLARPPFHALGHPARLGRLGDGAGRAGAGGHRSSPRHDRARLGQRGRRDHRHPAQSGAREPRRPGIDGAQLFDRPDGHLGPGPPLPALEPAPAPQHPRPDRGRARHGLRRPADVLPGGAPGRRLVRRRRHPPLDPPRPGPAPRRHAHPRPLAPLRAQLRGGRAPQDHRLSVAGADPGAPHGLDLSRRRGRGRAAPGRA